MHGTRPFRDREPDCVYWCCLTRSRFSAEAHARRKAILSGTGHQTFCCFVKLLTILFADLADCLSSIASNEAIMKLSSLLAFAGTLPLPAELSRRTDWRKPFALLFHALHESRRRQAARELGRHQHLLDRYRRYRSEKPSSER
jgi:hypothetical protein